MAAVDPRSKKKTDQIKRIVYKEETRAHAKKVSIYIYLLLEINRLFFALDELNSFRAMKYFH